MSFASSTYGEHLILDIWDADPRQFTREKIKHFLVLLCDRIEMKRADLHFWDYKGDPKAYKAAPDHLKGTSAVQFIQTSTVTIHTLDVLRQVYVDVFSCKPFDADLVKTITRDFFGGRIINSQIVRRL